MGRSQIWDGTQWVSMTGGGGEGGGDLDLVYLRLDGVNNNPSPTNWLRETDADSLYLGISANAVSASRWATARTLALSGDVSGSALIDGSANVTISVVVADDSHVHDSRYYTEGEVAANYLTISNPAATGTLSIDGKAVLSFLTANVVQLKRDTNVIVSSDGANWMQLGGMPFATAQFDVVCDESGALRTIKYTGSSRRFKKDIADAEIDPMLVLSLRPRTFKLKPESADDHVHLGFIAEELYDVNPMLSRYDDENVNNIDRDGVLAAIVSFLHSVNDRLTTLESSSVSV